MPPESENGPSGSTREEAKRTLNRVLRRYGIHLNQRATAQKQERPLPAPRIHSEIATTEPAISKRPFSRLPQRERPKRVEVAEVLLQHESDNGSPHGKSLWGNPQVEPRAQQRRFNYLIRIPECALILDCEVTAQSAIDAREKVERIPNLTEWREVSKKELAEIQAKQTQWT
jgi:hypothetical protein